MFQVCFCYPHRDAAFMTLPTRWHKHQCVSSVLANQNKNSVLTVMPQKAAVFFPNLCRNHCHNGMLITAESWVNRDKRGKCLTRGRRIALNVFELEINKKMNSSGKTCNEASVLWKWKIHDVEKNLEFISNGCRGSNKGLMVSWGEKSCDKNSSRIWKKKKIKN